MRVYNTMAVAAICLMATISNALTPENKSFLEDTIDKLHVTIEVSSAAGLAKTGESANISQQKVSLALSNQEKDLLDILNSNLGKESGYNLKDAFIIQGRFEGTAAAYLTENQVRDSSYKSVDEAVEKGLAAKKSELYEAAPKLIEENLRQQITQAINNNPALAGLTQEQRNQLIESQVAAMYPQVLAQALPLVHAKINAALAKARPGQIALAREEHVDSRLPELQTETTFQRLDTTVGIPINTYGNRQDSPPGMLLFAFGKAHPDIGAALKRNGLSRWENIIGHSSEAERANTVASTGYASVGMSYRISKDLNLMVNFVGYHDRDPWMSAQQYIKRSLIVAREVFDKNQQVYALNSAAVNVRVSAKLTPKLTGQFWGTLTKRFDGNRGDELMGYSFGGTIDVEPTKTTINFSYANSGKAYFNQAYSIGIAQTLIEKKANTWMPGLLLYTDFRGVNHKVDVNDYSVQKSETQLVALGANVDICKYINKGLEVDCKIVGEYQKRLNSSGYQSPTTNDDFYVGVLANARYQIK